MKIALCSDLHLEFSNVELKNTDSADVLILAGDILLANDLENHPLPDVPYTAEQLKNLGSRQLRAHRYREFISQCSSEFNHVIAISGNHEFYDGKWNGSIDTLYNEYGKFSNVHFLEQDTIVINGIRFIGATIWTDMNKGDPLTLHTVSQIMNDYRVIKNDALGYTKLRPAHTISRHRKSVKYIKSILQQFSNDPTVIVGHHTPTPLSIHEKFKNEPLLNGAYHSDLSDIMLDNTHIKLWACGHVHNPHMYYIGDTLVACNPRGYQGYEEIANTFALKYIDLNTIPEKFDGVKWGR